MNIFIYCIFKILFPFKNKDILKSDNCKMSYTDDQIRAAVDVAFAKFDRDNSGTIDENEIPDFINSALRQMGVDR